MWFVAGFVVGMLFMVFGFVELTNSVFAKLDKELIDVGHYRRLHRGVKRAGRARAMLDHYRGRR